MLAHWYVTLFSGDPVEPPVVAPSTTGGSSKKRTVMLAPVYQPVPLPRIQKNRRNEAILLALVLN